jgi:hypothetical protein
LWILANSGGKMDRSRLRRCTGLRLADLNLILGELAREGRITGDEVCITPSQNSWGHNPPYSLALLL